MTYKIFPVIRPELDRERHAYFGCCGEPMAIDDGGGQPLWCLSDEELCAVVLEWAAQRRRQDETERTAARRRSQLCVVKNPSE